MIYFDGERERSCHKHIQSLRSGEQDPPLKMGEIKCHVAKETSHAHISCLVGLLPLREMARYLFQQLD